MTRYKKSYHLYGDCVAEVVFPSPSLQISADDHWFVTLEACVFRVATDLYLQQALG